MTVEIGVIGTAGRREAIHMLNAGLYLAAYERLLTLMSGVALEDRHLRSGGAAWMDHLAVAAFLSGQCASLKLYFPCPWDSKLNRFVDAGRQSPGEVANYYHTRFAKKLTGDSYASLRGLQQAMARGAQVFVLDGFKARNIPVGQVETLYAFTFGPVDVPADGGTKHTWTCSPATAKVHVPLGALVPASVPSGMTAGLPVSQS